MEHVVSKDSTRLAYWRRGHGRPLVLVHGSTADHTRWDPLLPFLEPHVKACAMDRRGRGASGDTLPYSLDREVEDVAVLVDALARATGAAVDLFGHSFGAMCAVQAALLTTRVRKLVLYEPIMLANGPPGFADRADALLAEGRREDVIVLLLRDVLKMPDEDVAALRSAPSWRMRVAAAHTLPREDRAESTFRFDPARYRDIRPPVLLLAGSETPAFLRASTDALAAALPDARVVVLHGQEHMAISTAPRLVTEKVLGFLAQ